MFLHYNRVSLALKTLGFLILYANYILTEHSSQLEFLMRIFSMQTEKLYVT